MLGRFSLSERLPTVYRRAEGPISPRRFVHLEYCCFAFVRQGANGLLWVREE